MSAIFVPCNTNKALHGATVEPHASRHHGTLWHHETLRAILGIREQSAFHVRMPED